MRRVLSFTFSGAVLGGGVYLVWMPFRCMLGIAEGQCYVIGKLVIGGGIMSVIGGYLLWDDFIRPWLSKQRS